jgi:hypothetical protein
VNIGSVEAGDRVEIPFPITERTVREKIGERYANRTCVELSEAAQLRDETEHDGSVDEVGWIGFRTESEWRECGCVLP